MFKQMLKDVLVGFGLGFVYGVLFLLTLVLLAKSCTAQEISPAALQRMHQNTQDAAFKAKQNAISGNPIGVVASSRENAENQDRNFTHVIKRGKVTDQQKSGRCWLFAGLNIVRYDMANSLNVDDFELSENYLFFYHKLELSNYMLEMAVTDTTNADDPTIAWTLRNGLSDGGYWGMFVSLVEKYGAVPKSVMPETQHSSNTHDLGVLLDALVKRHVVAIWNMRQQMKIKGGKNTPASIRTYKERALAEIYQFLALMLGTPPEHFKWRYVDKTNTLHEYQQYTPQGFFARYGKPSIKNLVHLMNDPSLTYYKLYSMEGLRNVFEEGDETFLNVPPAALLGAAQRSVMGNQPVWFGSDVMAYADIKNGTLSLDNYDYDALLGIPIKMSKSERLKTYASAATHAMVLMGVDNSQLGMPIKWLVENSWGPTAGEGGYLVMTTDWFWEYGFDIVVDKRFLDPDVAKAMISPAVVLPPWHHLWRPMD